MKNNSVNYCVGIDGCKDGWVVVYCPPLAFNEAKAKHYRQLSLLENDFGNRSSIIIDMPIGLEVTEPNRQCDIEARKFLGSRGSTIFSPPCLDAISSITYEEAKSINHKKTGKSIEKGTNKANWNGYGFHSYKIEGRKFDSIPSCIFQ